MPLETCHPDASVDEVIDIMQVSNVRRLPIVDEDGQTGRHRVPG